MPVHYLLSTDSRQIRIIHGKTVLVLEFESHRGEIVNVFAKRKKWDELLAYFISRMHSDTCGRPNKKQENKFVL